MDEEHTEQFKDSSDLCQQLMHRYANSTAPQHRHLLATAAALRSNLAAESLPLTPAAYFAASISSLDAESLDSTALSALISFMAIGLSLVKKGAIAPSKSREAVEIIVALLDREGTGMGVSTVRAAVKGLGVLVGFCDLEDWDSVKLGFQTLLKFSIDKRPKVRRCAQEALVKVFGSFQSSTLLKEASKLVLSVLQSCIAMAKKIIALGTVDKSKDDTLSKPEHLEVLHVLNVVNLIAPYLHAKIILKVLSEVHKLFVAQIPAHAMHTLKTIEAIFEASRVRNIVPETEDIVVSLASFVSSGDKNPLDTVIFAASLLRHSMDFLHTGQTRLWIKNLPLVCRSILGLLTFEGNTASQASSILVGLLKHHVGPQILSSSTDQTVHDSTKESMDGNALKSTCAVFENALSAADGIPNVHVLSVISVLFLELGEVSFELMGNIVLKLADWMNQSSGGKVDDEHLQKCIGSAVSAMGAERCLTLIPISLNEHNYTYSNTWLVPILKCYVTGASLAYYVEHIMPLAKSFKKASRKVKKSGISQDLLARAHELWALLPSFCRHTTDTYQNFTSLSDVLITFLKKDPSMHESVSTALQILVNENKAALSSKNSKSSCLAVNDSSLEFGVLQPTYSKKTAAKNIKSLASCSKQLLCILSDLFISSLPEMRLPLKGAIGCLASITDSSVTQEVFESLLTRFLFLDEGEAEMLISDNSALDCDSHDTERYSQRCLMLEIASCFVEGASDNLFAKICNLTIHSFKYTNESVHREAYNCLNKILEKHSCHSSPRYMELIDTLLNLKPPADITTLRSRYGCFRSLIVNSVKTSLVEEENPKAFLVLNEIILTLKDVKRDEARKEACDLLFNISSSLRDSSGLGPNEPYKKLVSMVMGYLSGSSPHIRSGAVSALSVFVYRDPYVCLLVSDLVPSLLSLLQTKDIEIIKAVLGFVKVLVSSLEAKELQNFLSDVVTEIFPWSSVSRHHFRSKVTVILEILMRKCGAAAVKLITPEKYRDFLKTVLENRHGKSSEGATKNTENMPEGSFAEGPERRKPRSTDHQDKGAVKYRKRKWEKKSESVPHNNEPLKSTSSDESGLTKRSRYSNDKNSDVGASGGSEKVKKEFKGFNWKRKVKRPSKGKDKSSSHASKSHKGNSK